MLPDVCTCAPGWNGVNCETGENINLLAIKLMFGVLDIDECNGDHVCDHGCTNVNGSFACSCDSGYELQSDGRTCEGFIN